MTPCFSPRKKMIPASFPARPRFRTQLFLENLESRTLLSGSGLSRLLAQPAFQAVPLAGIYNGSGFTPSQIQSAYGLGSVVANLAATSNSSNLAAAAAPTIAIVDAFDDPNITADLQAFDSTFGLPAPPHFTKENQFGLSSPLPSANSGWAMEISLDVEWAHAADPLANILLVEANSANLNDLLTAVQTAVNHPGVVSVSMSWGGTEFSAEGYYDQTVFSNPNVTFVASAGDNGGYRVGSQWVFNPYSGWTLTPVTTGLWPALSPDVVSVGGTSLTTSGSETAWQYGGGGQSIYENAPTYQVTSLNLGPGYGRLGPDVAYNADVSNTDGSPGYAVYNTYGSGWYRVGGTSAGAPQIAALVTTADQVRYLSHLAPLSTSQTLGVLYNPSTYTQNFKDITTGSNGYVAGRGFDLATGLGVPNAPNLVSTLANVGVTPTAMATVSSGSSTSPGSPPGKTTARIKAAAALAVVVPPPFLPQSITPAAPVVAANLSPAVSAPILSGEVALAPLTSPMPAGSTSALAFPIYPTVLDISGGGTGILPVHTPTHPAKMNPVQPADLQQAPHPKQGEDAPREMPALPDDPPGEDQPGAALPRPASNAYFARLADLLAPLFGGKDGTRMWETLAGMVGFALFVGSPAVPREEEKEESSPWEFRS